MVESQEAAHREQRRIELERGTHGVKPPAPAPEDQPVGLIWRLIKQLWLRWRGFGQRIDDHVKLAILKWLSMIDTVRFMRALIEGLRHDLDSVARELTIWRRMAAQRPDLAKLYNQMHEEMEKERNAKA